MRGSPSQLIKRFGVRGKGPKHGEERYKMPLIENPWGQATVKTERLGGPSPKLSDRVTEKLERTKEAASAGVEKTKAGARKVKEGASSGVNWLKLKCNKNKLFQKK
ncbi:Unknown protein [Striga hermonthica]|uniref:Uncharacterized protein n=1 Tax=Striga hermonthica TaxID=68872 RepID=A0A9N7N2S2_STRHE|nr:Unknown protein [Striga hermonthica]